MKKYKHETQDSKPKYNKIIIKIEIQTKKNQKQTKHEK